MQRIDPVVRAVLNLLKTRGGPITMLSNKSGVYDPLTQTVGVVSKSHTVQGIVDEAKVTFASQGLVKEGDKHIFMRPDENTPNPTTGDTEFKIKGETFRAYLVNEVNPSGDNVIYFEVFARR